MNKVPRRDAGTRANGSRQHRPPYRINLSDLHETVGMSRGWGISKYLYACRAGHRITVITISRTGTGRAPVPVGYLICPLCQAGVDPKRIPPPSSMYCA